MKVYRAVNQAYGIRSVFIHGSQVQDKQRRHIDALCKDVSEYARVSLLVFYQLKGAVEKEELINKLDNSLLEEKALERVRGLIGEEIVITK